MDIIIISSLLWCIIFIINNKAHIGKSLLFAALAVGLITLCHYCLTGSISIPFCIKYAGVYATLNHLYLIYKRRDA